MATWMVHLRVCDFFLDRLNEKAGDEFLVGSIAPDCGYGEKDSFAGFMPPATITHWTETGRKTDIDIDKFYNTYLRSKNAWEDAPFYLGYYIHLLTDIKWSSQMYLPTRIKYRKEYEENPQFLLEIKKDWNDLDHLFLKKHPDFRAYKRFAAITKIKDYLPYYQPGQLEKQCRMIVKYYEDFNDYDSLEREYPYLTETKQNEFVNLIYESVNRFLEMTGIL